MLLLSDPFDGTEGQDNTIGTVFDSSNSIIIGGKFKNIDAPNSIISNTLKESLPNTGNKVKSKLGSNIVFGYDNDLSGVPFSFILGSENKVYNNSLQETVQQVEVV